jgi:outer membrane protein assembly factor BamC
MSEHMYPRHTRLYLAIVLLGLMAGCGSTPENKGLIRDRSIDYKTSKTLPALEVPPDLTSSTIDASMAVPDVAPAAGSATYSAYASERATRPASGASGVLPTPQGIRVERDGDQRWLVMQGEPGDYWDRVRQFWLENGMLLTVENPEIGIMETDWAENRANLPNIGVLRGLLQKVSPYSTAERDKFRTRLERGIQPGTTELYLTHRGMEEVARSDNPALDDSTIWKPRPSDPELEAEMLYRLMVYLGVDQHRADTMLSAAPKQEERARLVRASDGQVSLTVEEDFSQAWRRTGLALDRVGFTVEDRDRSQGIYIVRYVDPEAGEKRGFFSKLFSGDKKDRNVEYQLKLVADAQDTEVVVLDKDGRRDNGDTAGRILSLLHEQLK